MKINLKSKPSLKSEKDPFNDHGPRDTVPSKNQSIIGVMKIDHRISIIFVAHPFNETCIVTFWNHVIQTISNKNKDKGG